jgi:hypothetical protein
MSVISAVARLRAHPALLPGLVGIGGIAALVYVSQVDPNHPGHYPTCPWLALTGTYCPGCGTLRMLHSFTHGQFVHGFGLNPLGAIVFAWAGVEYARWAFASATGRRYVQWPQNKWWVWGVLVVILVYWVVRNLPFGAALAP